MKGLHGRTACAAAGPDERLITIGSTVSNPCWRERCAVSTKLWEPGGTDSKTGSTLCETQAADETELPKLSRVAEGILWAVKVGGKEGRGRMRQETENFGGRKGEILIAWRQRKKRIWEKARSENKTGSSFQLYDCYGLNCVLQQNMPKP